MERRIGLRFLLPLGEKGVRHFGGPDEGDVVAARSLLKTHNYFVVASLPNGDDAIPTGLLRPPFGGLAMTIG